MFEEDHRVDVEAAAGESGGEFDRHHRVEAHFQQVVVRGDLGDVENPPQCGGQVGPEPGFRFDSGGHGFTLRLRGGGQDVVGGRAAEDGTQQGGAVVRGEGGHAVGGGPGGDVLAHADRPQPPAEAVPGAAGGALAGREAVQVGVGRGVGALAEVGAYRGDGGEEGDEAGRFVGGGQFGEGVRAACLGAEHLGDPLRCQAAGQPVAEHPGGVEDAVEAWGVGEESGQVAYVGGDDVEGAAAAEPVEPVACLAFAGDGPADQGQVGAALVGEEFGDPQADGAHPAGDQETAAAQAGRGRREGLLGLRRGGVPGAVPQGELVLPARDRRERDSGAGLQVGEAHGGAGVLHAQGAAQAPQGGHEGVGCLVAADLVGAGGDDQQPGHRRAGRQVPYQGEDFLECLGRGLGTGQALGGDVDHVVEGVSGEDLLESFRRQFAGCQADVGPGPGGRPVVGGDEQDGALAVRRRAGRVGRAPADRLDEVGRGRGQGVRGGRRGGLQGDAVEFEEDFSLLVADGGPAADGPVRGLLARLPLDQGEHRSRDAAAGGDPADVPGQAGPGGSGVEQAECLEDAVEQRRRHERRRAGGVVAGAHHGQYPAGAPARGTYRPVGGAVGDAAGPPPRVQLGERHRFRAPRAQPGHVEVAGRWQRGVPVTGGGVLGPVAAQ